MKLRSLLFLAIAAMFFICSTEGSAQNRVDVKGKNWEFCSGDSYSNGEKVGAKELREMTVADTGRLTVDSGKNGGIKIKGENRSDILVRACVQTWATTSEAAQSTLKSVRIDTGSIIKADGAGDEWAVSYQILVPNSTDLNLTANNGGITIDGVEGTMEFRTMNGGLHLSGISGNVKGRTTNGGVHVELAGNAWRGNGLDLETTNGGVHVSLPSSYAAHFETGTTNGGFHSSFSQLELPKTDRQERRRPGGRISADINGGGAPIRLITTNGGVHIGSDNDDNE